MKNKKPSISVGRTLESIIDSIGPAHNHKVSTTINAIAGRYDIMIDYITPVMTIENWTYAVGCYKKWHKHYNLPPTPYEIVHEMSFKRKVDLVEAIAIIHIAEVYHSSPDLSLADAGAKIKE